MVDAALPLGPALGLQTKRPGLQSSLEETQETPGSEESCSKPQSEVEEPPLGSA